MTLDQAGRIQRLMPGRPGPEETIKIKGVNPDPKLVQVLLCLQCLVSTYTPFQMLLLFNRPCNVIKLVDLKVIFFSP